jgi:chorismate synthase
MSGSSYGKEFVISTFGESHGPGLGVIIDGATPGMELAEEDIQIQLRRRRPGQSVVSTPRFEADKCEIVSGVFEGKATGTPIMVLIRNTSERSRDYHDIKDIFRPGHADYTFHSKFGFRDYRGGGRSSGRETAARVAAGAIAMKMLEAENIKIQAYALEIAGIRCEKFVPECIETNDVRACDPDVAEIMKEKIMAAMKDHNSVGGIIECRISGVPAGLGEPVFDKLDAELSKAVMSLGAVKGIEFGSGFACARMTGKEHNDPIRPEGFLSNHAGGILGGISSGQEIVFRAAVKPTASISQKQLTIDKEGQPAECEVFGRHDPCICPRIVPVVEAMSAIVLVDMLKRHRATIS